MLITTCCSYPSNTAYELCPDCLEHCDWEVIDEDEWNLREDEENKIEEEKINKLN